jgi:hypothetical protein
MLCHEALSDFRFVMSLTITQHAGTAKERLGGEVAAKKHGWPKLEIR